jgi:hypothetical protein
MEKIEIENIERYAQIIEEDEFYHFNKLNKQLCQQQLLQEENN